jgi:16S rRNA G966 N2-methylase RsmD
MDALKFLERTNQQFDLIFSDPPFASTMHQAILELTFQRNILREQGLLILEHGSKSNFEQVTNFTQARNFGNVTFSFFEIQ